MSELPICLYRVRDDDSIIAVNFDLLSPPEGEATGSQGFDQGMRAMMLLLHAPFSVAFAGPGILRLMLLPEMHHAFRSHAVMRKLILNEAAAGMVAFCEQELQFLPFEAREMWPPSFHL